MKGVVSQNLSKFKQCSGKCHQIDWNSKLTAQKVKREGIINTANTKGDADEQSRMRFKRMPIFFFLKLVSLTVSKSLLLLLLTFDITHLSDTKLSFWYLQVVSEPFTEIQLKEHEEESL